MSILIYAAISNGQAECVYNRRQISPITVALISLFAGISAPVKPACQTIALPPNTSPFKEHLTGRLANSFCAVSFIAVIALLTFLNLLRQ